MNSITIYYNLLDDTEKYRLGELVDIAIATELDYETKHAKSNLISIGLEFPAIEVKGRFFGYKDALEWLLNC